MIEIIEIIKYKSFDWFLKVISRLSVIVLILLFSCNAEGEFFDNVVSRTSVSHTEPELTTNSVTTITTTTALVGGVIISAGTPEYTQRGVVYSTSPNPTINTTFVVISGSGTGNFSIMVSGLLPNTTYYVRTYAINSVGTVYGEQMSFKTVSLLPTIITNAPTNVSTTTITLNGNITDVGTPAYTERGFVYATTQNPTTSNNKIQVSGSGTGFFSSYVSGLLPNTTYYIRTYAINTFGTVYGEQVTISTTSTNTSINVNIEMVTVQGSTFTLGCRDSNCNNRELPTHSVMLSSFTIGKYVVTQAQWILVMGNNPSYFSGNNLPVEQVSWIDIVGTSGNYMDLNGTRYFENGFIFKLNQITGKSYRLPTEAEWEYAARGGNQGSVTNIYSGSSTIDNVAWYFNNSNVKTQPVGSLSPNELGIYDMSGNVWEWCTDWYGDYTSPTKINPTGPTSGLNRVLRGGSWLVGAQNCRVAYRNYDSPNTRSSSIGFRVVHD